MRAHKVSGGIVAGLLLVSGAGQAQQEVVALAPPVAGRVGQETVFHWQELPQGQQVALTRACFDKAGYQLYDTVGETIIVPFAGDNLYVMKFGKSTNGTLYFVNDGGQPTLYVPDNGYLENATGDGGRWYPFSQTFQPAQPVYMGLAPSYTDYAGMGWYPGMTYQGGYYSTTPYVTGTSLVASPGLFFQIGNQPYYGWNGYYRYYQAHPSYRPISVYQPRYYTWAGRPRTSLRPFTAGGSTYYAHRPFGGVRVLNGILPSTAVTNRPPGSVRNPQVLRGGTPPSQTVRPGFGGFNGSITGNSVFPFRGGTGTDTRPTFRGNSGTSNSGSSRPGSFRPSGSGSNRGSRGSGRRGH